jgi:cellobiose phosphorylase
VRHLLGVRFEGTRVVVRPALYPDSPPIAADLRFRSGRLRIEIEGWGTIKKAYVDGTKLKRRSDGSIVLPGDFTSGTVRIQTDRRSGG